MVKTKHILSLLVVVLFFMTTDVWGQEEIEEPLESETDIFISSESRSIRKIKWIILYFFTHSIQRPFSPSADCERL